MFNWKLSNKSVGLAEKIMENIRCGLYEVDRRLPSERELSEHYQLSRNTVREALGELFRLEILERRGRGAYVATGALALIESGGNGDMHRIVVVLPFHMYDSPIYRTIFETARDVLGAQAFFEIVFTGAYPETVRSRITPKDIVWTFAEALPIPVMRDIAAITSNLVIVNNRNDFFNYIVPDNFAAGQMMAEYLYGCGHRRIGASIVEPEMPSEFSDRFNGSMDFFRRHPVEVLRIDKKPSNNRFELEQTFFETYCMRGKVTAVLCFEDISALMLYELARKNGVRIPEDLSVVGFDDRCYSGSVFPALSTVRYPAEAIGLELARAVLEGFRTGRLQLQRKVVPTLLRRDSVATIDR